MKAPKTDRLFNVCYYSQAGSLIETIANAVPITLAKWMQRTKGNTTHRMGVIKIEPN